MHTDIQTTLAFGKSQWKASRNGCTPFVTRPKEAGPRSQLLHVAPQCPHMGMSQEPTKLILLLLIHHNPSISGVINLTYAQICSFNDQEIRHIEDVQ